MFEDVLVAPSVLSADFARLGEDLKSIETADYVHFDVMDGHFVPNLTFGPDVLRAIKATTDVPVDAHLMISNPDEMTRLYVEAGADMVSFHLEATNHAHRIVSYLRESGVRPAVAINPATPVCMLDSIIEDVDMVLVMTVNPGFGGQKFIPSSVAKVAKVRALAKEHGVSPMIEVDGGVSEQNAGQICAAGANVIVAGSAVFKKDDRAAAIRAIKDAGQLGLAKRA